MTEENSASQLDRRQFLGLGLGAAAILLPSDVSAKPRMGGDRILSLHNKYTGESLRAIYWSNGRYVPENVRGINHLFRDHLTDEIQPINLRLLDLLYSMRGRLQTAKPICVISGYRSPSTNHILRAHSRRVAKNSYHMRGMAADLEIPGYSNRQLATLARKMKAGGVGYYPRSGFIHVDVGPVRYWYG